MPARVLESGCCVLKHASDSSMPTTITLQMRFLFTYSKPGKDHSEKTVFADVYRHMRPKTEKT